MTATMRRGDRIRIIAPHHLEGYNGEVIYRIGTQVGGPAPLVWVMLTAGYVTSLAESMVEHDNGSEVPS